AGSFTLSVRLNKGLILLVLYRESNVKKIK
ncbi:unnamed protein product, partial [marine sediment metagenome]